MRKLARELSFKLIYEYLFLREKREDIILSDIAIEEKFNEKDIDENDMAYIKSVYNGAISCYDEIIDIISSFSTGFKVGRIFKIDLAILVLAIYEMKNCSDIPNSVSINEAVELAKIYSTENSGKFINGILGSVDKSIK